MENLEKFKKGSNESLTKEDFAKITGLSIPELKQLEDDKRYFITTKGLSSYGNIIFMKEHNMRIDFVVTGFHDEKKQVQLPTQQEPKILEFPKLQPETPLFDVEVDAEVLESNDENFESLEEEPLVQEVKPKRGPKSKKN